MNAKYKQSHRLSDIYLREHFSAGKMKFQLPLTKSSSKKHSGRSAEQDAVRPLTHPVRCKLRHLGFMPVEAEAPNKRYRDGIGACALRTIVVMAKSSHKKGDEVFLEVTPDRVRVLDCSTHNVLVDASIQRVCFCTNDGVYNKVFAFIYRTPEREVMECHAFYCGAPQVAQSMAIAMNGAFLAALDNEQRVVQTQHSSNLSSSSVCSSMLSFPSVRQRQFLHAESTDSGAVSSSFGHEGDSASLNSSRSANCSDSIAVEVHAAPACEPVHPLRSWSSSDGVAQGNAVVSLRSAANYSCVLPGC